MNTQVTRGERNAKRFFPKPVKNQYGVRPQREENMRSALIIEFNSSFSLSFALGTIYFYKLRFHLFPSKGTVQILIQVLFRYHVIPI